MLLIVGDESSSVNLEKQLWNRTTMM